MGQFIQRGGLWVIVQNLLMLFALVLAPLTRAPSWHWGWFLAGGVLVFIGGVFGIAGFRELGRNLTPYPKPRDESELVQSGIYGVVRHPLYSSLIFGTLGWASLWSSLPALLVWPAFAVLLGLKARREERWLREKFPAYEEYSKRVRRLVPWIY